MSPLQAAGPGGRRPSRPWPRFLLYNLLLVVLLPVVIAYVCYRQLGGRRWRGGWRQRLGGLPPSPPGRTVIWAHAVSAGEMMALASIVRELRSLVPEAWILVTSLTNTGQEMAHRQCSGVADRVAYLPADFLPCAWLALRRVRPHLLVLTETELWPNLLFLARSRGARVVLVNGRISDRNLRRVRWLGWLYRALLGMVDRFCMQSAWYQGRVVALGAPEQATCALGNAKLDTLLAQASPEKTQALRQVLEVGEEDPLLVAGSTHPGEEAQVIAAFRLVLEQVPGCRLILAPRHVARARELQQALGEAGLRQVLRSELPGPPGTARQAQVIMLDTMGELAACFALGQAAFIGGSLVRIGGHNVLEPVAAGKPVLYGPYMHGQPDLERAVREGGVGFMVKDSTEMAGHWLRFLSSPPLQQELAQRAAAIIGQHQGAARRYAQAAWEVMGK